MKPSLSGQATSGGTFICGFPYFFSAIFFLTSAETNRKGAGSGSSPTVNSILVPGILLENRENRVLAESKLIACIIGLNVFILTCACFAECWFLRLVLIDDSREIFL